MLSPCLFVCLFVYYQDYTKNTEGISTKPGGRMGHGKNPLNFCMYLDKEVDPGMFFISFFNIA